MNPVISVVVPVHNVSGVIHRSIVSIANQSFKEFELIVVENGSTDNTYTVAKVLLEKKLPNNYLLYKINKANVSTARNVGIQLARGRYIFFLDADDSVTSNILEKLYISIERNSADISYCPFDRVRKGKIAYKYEQMFCNKVNQKNIFSGTEFIKLFLLGKTWVRIGNCLVKKDIIESKNVYFPEDLEAGEDQYFFLKYLFHSKKVVFSDEARMFYYDDNSNSLANSVKVFDAVKAYKIYASEIEKFANNTTNKKFGFQVDDYLYESNLSEIINIIKEFKIPYLYLRGLYRIAKNSSYRDFEKYRRRFLKEIQEVQQRKLYDLPSTPLKKMTVFGYHILIRAPFLFYMFSKYLL